MALSSGVYSLIGVVVGSATTSGAQLWVAARGDRRRRAAIRSVYSEFDNAAAMIEFAADRGEEYWPAVVPTLATDKWEQYADDLAGDSRIEFGKLERAFVAARVVRMHAQQYGEVVPGVSAEAVQQIREAVDYLKAQQKQRRVS